MKAIILNTITAVLARVNLYMLCCSVQYVGHSYALQVADVADGLAIPYDDPIVHLVTVNSHGSSLIVISGRLEAWHCSVLSCSCVDY